MEGDAGIHGGTMTVEAIGVPLHTRQLYQHKITVTVISRKKYPDEL